MMIMQPVLGESFSVSGSSESGGESRCSVASNFSVWYERHVVDGNHDHLDLQCYPLGMKIDDEETFEHEMVSELENHQFQYHLLGLLHLRQSFVFLLLPKMLRLQMMPLLWQLLTVATRIWCCLHLRWSSNTVDYCPSPSEANNL